jgi:hypothetical protein
MTGIAGRGWSGMSMLFFLSVYRLLPAFVDPLDLGLRRLFGGSRQETGHQHDNGASHPEELRGHQGGDHGRHRGSGATKVAPPEPWSREGPDWFNLASAIRQKNLAWAAAMFSAG